MNRICVILNSKTLTVYEKIACIALAEYTNKRGECEISIGELANLCGCGRSKVISVLNALEKKNIISRESQFIEAEGGAQTVNKYILNFL
jgi:hypothetical protein